MAATRRADHRAGRSKQVIPDRAPTRRFASWLLLSAVLFAQALVVGGVFAPVIRAQALSLDDSEYFADNPLVRNPSWSSVSTFFAEVARPSTVEGYYHPLTMVSLMLDQATMGNTRDLSGFHRTALLLHIANSLLLTILCYSLFGNAIFSCTAALIFALHSLCVEPVAWITERKTLLAAFFSLISLVSYVKYARGGRWRFLILTCFAYLLALLSKPTALPLPLMLLVVDVWPLRRLSWRCVFEKTPAWILGVSFGIISLVSQSRSGHISLQANGIIQAVTRCTYLLGFYFHNVVWPGTLCGFNQVPEPLSLTNPVVLGKVLLCLGILLISFSLVRRTWAPAACVLLFCLAILPTLGVLRSGFADAADKYTYLPMCGLVLLVPWALGRMAGRQSPNRGNLRWVMAIALTAVLLAESRATRYGLAVWKDTESLFEHLLTFSPDNGRIRTTYAAALSRKGRASEAGQHFRRALASSPSDPIVVYNAGLFMQQQGNTAEAISLYERAVKLWPDDDLIMHNLATALASAGRRDEAKIAFERTLSMNPGLYEAHANYAALLEQIAQPQAALTHWRLAMGAPVPDPQAMGRLARLLASNPDTAMQNTVEAVAWAERACNMTGRRDPTLLDILATTYGRCGRFDEAIRAASEALKLFKLSGATAAVSREERNIAAFQVSKGR